MNNDERVDERAFQAHLAITELEDAEWAPGTCLSCRAAGFHWDTPRDDGSCYECGGPIGKWNEPK